MEAAAVVLGGAGTGTVVVDEGDRAVAGSGALGDLAFGADARVADGAGFPGGGFVEMIHKINS